MNLKEIIISINIIFLLGVFDLTFLSYVQIASLFSFSVLGVLLILNGGLVNLPKAAINFSLICIFILMVNIVNLKNFYGTPLLKGVLISLRYFNVLSILIFVKMNKIRMKNILMALRYFTIVWSVTLIVFYFIGYEYVIGDEIIHPGKWNKTIFLLMAFLTFYKEKKSTLDIFLIFIFLAIPFLVDFQRIVFLGLLGSFCIKLLYDSRGLKQKLKMILTLIVTLSFVAIWGYATIINKFNFISELDSSNTTSDTSVAGRIHEYSIAIESIKSRPIFGSGLYNAEIKNQILPNEYFYPSDLGIIGIQYTFGLFGILITFYLIFKLRKLNFKTSLDKGLKYFLIFLLLTSFANGNILFKPTTIAAILLLHFLSKKSVLNERYFNR